MNVHLFIDNHYTVLARIGKLVRLTGILFMAAYVAILARGASAQFGLLPSWMFSTPSPPLAVTYRLEYWEERRWIPEVMFTFELEGCHWFGRTSKSAKGRPSSVRPGVQRCWNQPR